jgi:hypothetical protein
VEQARSRGGRRGGRGWPPRAACSASAVRQELSGGSGPCRPSRRAGVPVLPDRPCRRSRPSPGSGCAGRPGPGSAANPIALRCRLVRPAGGCRVAGPVGPAGLVGLVGLECARLAAGTAALDLPVLGPVLGVLPDGSAHRPVVRPLPHRRRPNLLGAASAPDLAPGGRAAPADRRPLRIPSRRVAFPLVSRVCGVVEVDPGAIRQGSCRARRAVRVALARTSRVRDRRLRRESRVGWSRNTTSL